MPFTYLLTVILILGVSPLFWYIKDSVLSDIPGLAFLFGGICLFEYKTGKIWVYALTAFLFAYAYFTRATHLLIIPAIAVAEIIKLKSNK